MTFEKSNPILYSKDVAMSVDYYKTVLGFDDGWVWDDDATFGGVVKGGVEIFFCKENQGHPGTWVAIILDNVDEYYTLIKNRGAKILTEPKDEAWNMREMFVQDPDGHIIRFGNRIECD
jgi:catechol 2,3-dioxygenase-like lactoylglutathione lyase family enzyme